MRATRWDEARGRPPRGGRRTRGWALLVALTTAGCGILPGPPPEWVVNRNPLELCGTEEVGHAGGWNVEARECLLAAHRDGRGAELISTQTTVEGDPITSYIRVHANGTVELFIDATRDAYSSGLWERIGCDRLLTVEEANDPPDLVYPTEVVFVQDGCRELPVP